MFASEFSDEDLARIISESSSIRELLMKCNRPCNQNYTMQFKRRATKLGIAYEHFSSRSKSSKENVERTHNGEKLCSKCNQIKSIDLFYKIPKLPSGLRGWCIACTSIDGKKRHLNLPQKVREERRSQKDLDRNIIRNYLFDYLEKSKCVDCGTPDILVLEFDHIDSSTKSHNISEMSGFNLKLVVDEIAKCVVRCANCHRKKTHKERNSFKYRKSLTLGSP